MCLVEGKKEGILGGLFFCFGWDLDSGQIRKERAPGT